MQTLMLAEQAKPFLNYLDDLTTALTALPLATAASTPANIAIISVDVINGFCYEGALSSPRVETIVQPIASLFERAWSSGVRNIVLIQEFHEPDAVEFGQFPPHCVRGTSEAETVAAFTRLPFFNEITVMHKNSISSGLNTGLNDWVKAHPEVDTFIVVGDCTDLCTYQLAMHLRLDANARQQSRRVIVPANCTQTYDRPISAAVEQGGLPHPGDLLHAVFLYHMLLNGIEVVSEIA